MSLARMTIRRVKVVMAWVIAIAILGLLVLGTIWLSSSLGWI